ncbi:uncharacterized protein TERG_11895 [Trichophyton rubrum CBS 118892]|uniref:Uncharacterized protein n=1 Tax=Trichophyton rubrum (strain ATCC MYA-4607 / CBS 118892) TaxID=559305 RepID=A0A080WJR5_TRIRC|nr:uncharacterized protein TERG_11895 [Trichophyton rubrum CBS 118892]KFL60962.1 hypothetical protein TERG_11895 [Trichophyton rubrum CBS 118892]
MHGRRRCGNLACVALHMHSHLPRPTPKSTHTPKLAASPTLVKVVVRISAILFPSNAVFDLHQSMDDLCKIPNYSSLSDLNETDFKAHVASDPVSHLDSHERININARKLVLVHVLRMRHVLSHHHPQHSLDYALRLFGVQV